VYARTMETSRPRMPAATRPRLTEGVVSFLIPYLWAHLPRQVFDIHRGPRRGYVVVYNISCRIYSSGLGGFTKCVQTRDLLLGSFARGWGREFRAQRISNFFLSDYFFYRTMAVPFAQGINFRLASLHTERQPLVGDSSGHFLSVVVVNTCRRGDAEWGLKGEQRGRERKLLIDKC